MANREYGNTISVSSSAVVKTVDYTSCSITAVACVSLLYCGRRLGASEKRAAAAAAAATAHNSAAVGGEAVLRLAQLGEVQAVPLFFIVN